MHEIRGGHTYWPRSTIRGTEAVPSSKLVDSSSVSYGGRRAGPDVRQAARMTMLARGSVAHRCPAPLPRAAVGGSPATAGRERPSARQQAGGRLLGLLRLLAGDSAAATPTGPRSAIEAWFAPFCPCRG